MMASPADAIQAAIAAGYAQAAMAIGTPHKVFRPSGASAPMDPGNLVATLPAAWKPAVPGDKFQGAVTHGKATWYGYYDLRAVRVGDYLVRQSDGGTYFVAAQQPMLQPVGIECNAVLTVARPSSSGSVGAVGYGGDVRTSEQPVLTGWPASVLTKSRGERGDTNLPDDTRVPWVEVLMPAIPGVGIKFADVLTDATGRRFITSSTEVSALGWRLLAQEAPS